MRIRISAIFLVLQALPMLFPAGVVAQPVEWTRLFVTGPSPRDRLAMSYDSARGVTVLFGGYRGVFPFPESSETWEWDGTAWTQRIVGGPIRRDWHAMSYDSARGVTVLFGGQTASAPNNDTWEWNGTEWTQRMVSGPSARFGHAMVYDAARGVTVLFGGTSGNARYDDTWEWNGTIWMQRAVPPPPPDPPPAHPTARHAHAMAYDTARGVTVLFGGYTGTNNDETWEWDGTTWTQRVASAPSPRAGHSMAYDAARGVTVLFGGGDNRNNETWEWNGTAWTQRSISGPSPRSNHAAAYDVARAATVLFGGYTGAENGETWELRVACIADFNADGTVNSQDFFDFLSAFFASAPAADFNHDGVVNSQDFFDFLTAFFAGC